MADRFCVVLTTVPNAKLGEKLAKGLVKESLAACVNVVGGVVSHYRWQSRLHKDRELLLIIKTQTRLLPKLMRFIKKNHSAQVPEIISLPIKEGLPAYLKWLAS